MTGVDSLGGRWLRAGGWRPPSSPARTKRLDGLDAWLAERSRRHGGNADVVRQDLAREHGDTEE